MLTFEADTTKFTAMCRDLSKLTGATFTGAVEYEVGRVLESAIAHTPAAQIDKIRSASENAQFSAQPDTLYTPTTDGGRRSRAKAHRTSKKNLLLYFLTNRYPDVLWNAILEARKSSLARKINARGFAKWTWVKIASQLGIGIRIPGYITTAGGHIQSDVTSVRKEATDDRVGIWIENASTVLQSPFVKGAGALQKAINGRVSYFRRNLRTKVFDTIKSTAKKYPGVTVS